jgi:bifunctional non-homologous end joining protein LigD
VDGPLPAHRRGREPSQGAVLPDRRRGVCCDERGLAIFQKLRQRREEHRAFLYAFDLLELDGTDLRREPRLEGIVSKRPGSRYRSGRSPDWLKFKNPAAPAVKREAEEDWTK